MKHLLMFLLLLSSLMVHAESEFDLDSMPMDLNDGSFLSYPPSSFSPGDLECPQGNDPLAPLYEIKCKLNNPRDPGPKACDCIREKAMDNILIQADQFSAENDVAKEQEKRRKLYVEKYKNVFRRMTIDAEVQKKILGVEEKAPYVGCDPRSNATMVLGYAEKHYQRKNETLQNFKSELEKKYKSRCNESGQRKHILIRKDKCDELERSIAEIDRQLGVVKKKEANVGEACAVGLTSKPKNPFSVELQGYPACSRPNVNTGKEISEGLKDENPFFGDEKIKDKVSPECEGHKAPSLCQGFLDTKKDLEADVQKRYDHDPAKQCISFAEFQIFKSAPSKNLMAEFARKERKHKDLLLTPEDDKDLNGDRLKFLRNNPLIFQLARDNENRKVLSGALHTMAKNWDKMTPPQQLRAYLDFMGNKKKEGVVSALTKKDAGKTKMTMCDDMARNYTTIMVSDYLSAPNKMLGGQDRLNDLQTALRACMEKKNIKDAVDEGDKALNTDPVFTLAPWDTKKEEADIENEYQSFLKDYCGAKPNQLPYAEHVKQKCQGKDIEDCRQDYLSGTNWQSQNEEMKMAGVQPELSEKDWQDVQDQTDSSKQDGERKDWWYENIGRHRSQYPTPMKGEFKQYQQDRENDAKISSDAVVPPHFQQSSSQSSVAGSSTNGTGGSGSDAGNSDSKSDQKLVEKQVVPDFQPNPLPSFDKEKLRSGAPIDQAIPSLAGKSATEKVEILENFKQNLPSEDQDLLPKIEDAQELAAAEIPAPVEEPKKEKQEKIENKIANSNPSNGGGVLNKQAMRSVAGTGQIAGSISQPKVELNQAPKKDKTLQQLNQTLVDVNENKGNKVDGNAGGVSRGPASVSELKVSESTPAIVVDAFAKGDDLPKTAEGVLIVRDQDMVVKDSYNEIVNDKKKLSEFVKSSLKGEQIGSEVVRVTDSKTGLHTLLLVTPGKHGLIIKRVDRVATYKGLIYAQQAAVQNP